MIGSASVKTIAISLLCAVTILVLTPHDRWEIIGEELLAGTSFNSELSEWDYSKGLVDMDSEKPGVVILSLKKNATEAHIYQMVKDPGQFEHLTFSGEIKTDNIHKMVKSSYVARLLLISSDDTGKAIWNIPHAVVKLDGSNEWTRYEKTFRIYKEVKEIHVGAYLNRATGKMLVRNLSVRPSREKSGYVIARYLAMGAWALTALWIIPSFISLREFRISNFILPGIGALIIVAILTPMELLNYIVTLIDKSLPAVWDYIATIQNGGSNDISSPYARLYLGHMARNIHKVAHFSFFLFISSVALMLKPAIHPARMIGYLILFAVATEIMQLFTAGRGFSYGDMLLNITGVGVGLLACVFIKWILNNRFQRNNK